jgi:Bacterial Ig-like domain (group 3)/FG-GAP-like repeat
VSVLLGNGDGTFQAPAFYGSGGFFANSVAIADVNGDGHPDLIVADCGPNSATCGGPGYVGILLGDGAGNFQTAVNFPSGGIVPSWLAVADINGDGKPDVVVSLYSGLVSVLLNNTGLSSASTTTLNSSLNPSAYGQSVKFSSKVSSAAGTPTGTVIFYDGTNLLGSATLASGRAAIAVSSLAAASHLITAAYQGSSSFNASASSAHRQTVKTVTTTTSLVSSSNPASSKNRVIYTATVTSQYGGMATGTVTFQDGATALATVNVSNDQAVLTKSYTVPGLHSITATYSGDANNGGSMSSVLVESIENPSTTRVTTSSSPSFVGQPVTFTATVTSLEGAIPNGETVTFYDGSTAVGTGATAAGMATFTTSTLSAKTHTIKAVYPGDGTFKPSSETVTQVVNQYSTTTGLSSSLNPSTAGQAVTFTATVTSLGPNTPTGTVTFKTVHSNGTDAFGTATLVGGVATVTKSNFAVGTQSIIAVYDGDDESGKSTSAILIQVVN